MTQNVNSISVKRGGGNGQDQLKKGEKYSWCENWQDIFKKGRM